MTQNDHDFEEAIDDWDDLIEEAEPPSEVEDGSELAEAIRRKEIADRESGIVPPHGPRAYKRKAGSSAPPDQVADVSNDEVLFDDGADWRAQPTMRIVIDPEAPIAPPTEALPSASRANSRGVLVLGVAAALAAAAIVGATVFYAYEQRQDAERLEQHIKMQLEASE